MVSHLHINAMTASHDGHTGPISDIHYLLSSSAIPCLLSVRYTFLSLLICGLWNGAQAGGCIALSAQTIPYAVPQTLIQPSSSRIATALFWNIRIHKTGTRTCCWRIRIKQLHIREHTFFLSSFILSHKASPSPIIMPVFLAIVVVVVAISLFSHCWPCWLLMFVYLLLVLSFPLGSHSHQSAK